MIKLRNILIILLFFPTFLLLGQQVPYYNHNILNPFIYNPAMTGYNESISAFLVQNRRFSGFGMGAQNNFLTIDGKFIIPNSGIGLTVHQQSIGLQQQFSAQLSYSYQVNFNEKSGLRFGVNAGFFENRINTSSIDVFHSGDPFLAGLTPTDPTVDFNAGLAFVSENLRISAAVPQLLANDVKHSPNDSRAYYSLSRHFLGTAEYDFNLLSSKKLVLTPQVLVRYLPEAPIQYDITTHLDNSKLGWISFAYKSDYAVQGNIGVRIKEQFHVGYSYEYLIGTMSAYSSGMHHEFMLGYRFTSSKKASDTLSVAKVKALEEENKELKLKLENTEYQVEQQKKLMDYLNDKVSEKMAQLKEMKEKLDEFDEAVEATQENVEIRESFGNYKLLEADGDESPNGYYAVAGVFSNKDNLEKNMKREKKVFPNTYYVVNLYNGFYYTIISYSEDKNKALRALTRHKEVSPDDKNVWILHYE